MDIELELDAIRIGNYFSRLVQMRLLSEYDGEIRRELNRQIGLMLAGREIPCDWKVELPGIMEGEPEVSARAVGMF